MKRNPVRIINTNKEILDIELLFSFMCKENGKNYVVLNNHDEIFEPNSRYANLDIFEVVQTRTNALVVSDIPVEEWETVKKALQYEVFAKMK